MCVCVSMCVCVRQENNNLEPLAIIKSRTTALLFPTKLTLRERERGRERVKKRETRERKENGEAVWIDRQTIETDRQK